MFLSLIFAGLTTSAVVPRQAPEEPRSCQCSGSLIQYNASQEETYVCGDYRLGPALLPINAPLDTTLARYDRFNGLTPQSYLEKWTEEGTEPRRFRYPEFDGFLLDGQGLPIKSSVILPVGTLLDRFGYESGKGSCFLWFVAS